MRMPVKLQPIRTKLERKNWRVYDGFLVLAYLLIAALVYVMVSLWFYSFRYPELTQSQVQLNTKEALLWK